MRPDVTVVVPTIPPRRGSRLLHRALISVTRQDYPGNTYIECVEDVDGDGAAVTRNRALDRVATEWVAFLDDDDWLYPAHLRLCLDFADALNVDVVYPGYDVEGGEDPVKLFGEPFEPTWLALRNFIPVTVVARTSQIRAAGGFQPHPDEHGNPCEDWGLWRAMVAQGSTFAHLPERTWAWNLDSESTGGKPWVTLYSTSAKARSPITPPFRPPTMR